ncbi:hypothetical protein Q4E93_24935 [Flavitalea sp. BT771]|uniref:hypothetical protein n=1 Tax=Flavitalea sp. BT771 TaxID=3063329 RepID=UPI0026E1E5B8|nr:hypothetical protein [Flavitalea sp. BT771]MDO6433876.1 hypothetical protein [Flavitalea sp. BT771]MDV6222219.1 hypothetical protein [Flavitalea sp. BT771]
MSRFNQSSEELFDKIIYLEEEDKQEPLRVFRRFYNDYRLHELRYILWSMVEACLTTDNSEFSEPEERADLLLRCRHFEELLEAGWLLAGVGRAK